MLVGNVFLVRHWQGLHRKGEAAPFLDVLKTRLDGVLSW